MHLLSLTTQFQHKSQLEMKFSGVEGSLAAVLPHKTTLQGVFLFFFQAAILSLSSGCVDASAALDETPFFFIMLQFFVSFFFGKKTYNYSAITLSLFFLSAIFTCSTFQSSV